MNIKRFYAIFKARNIEFFRDKSSLSWSLLFPALLVAGMSFVFSGDGRPAYSVGVMALTEVDSPFLKTKHIDFIDYANIDLAKKKLMQHNLDMLVDFASKTYWVNQDSPKGYFVEKLFLSDHQDFQLRNTQGQKIRYVDWVLPGILGMNMMFSCLFGVGYVIVRYRKNSVLKRLKATPLTALEFVSAQLLSRMFIVMFTISLVYIGCDFFFGFYMQGSYFDLFIVAVLGSFSLITLGLLVACRSKSEELVGGLLNLSSWPMIILSGVWFSLEGAPKLLQQFAELLPLTHLVAGARMVITEGATLADISYHLGMLSFMSLLFLALGSYFFNWNTER